MDQLRVAEINAFKNYLSLLNYYLKSDIVDKMLIKE